MRGSYYLPERATEHCRIPQLYRCPRERRAGALREAAADSAREVLAFGPHPPAARADSKPTGIASRKIFSGLPRGLISAFVEAVSPPGACSEKVSFAKRLSKPTVLCRHYPRPWLHQLFVSLASGDALKTASDAAPFYINKPRALETITSPLVGG